jgi:hypothetical protein
MAAKAKRQPPRTRPNHRPSIKAQQVRSRTQIGPLAHAVEVIHRACCLAGDANLLEDIRRDLRAEGVTQAIQRHDTGAPNSLLTGKNTGKSPSPGSSAGAVSPTLAGEYGPF